MFIELSPTEAEIIRDAVGGPSLGNYRFDQQCQLWNRFKAIVAAGDEPRNLDAQGNVECSKRLTYYGDENDILEIASQKDIKLKPEQLDELVKVVVSENNDWADQVEDKLYGMKLLD